MARSYATIQTKIRDNPDWTGLTSPAQALYIHCLTHSTLEISGVLDWRPNRLATLATDWNTETVNHLGHELETAGFLVIDQDAEYAFIRSFHRHDGTMKQQNLGTSAARLITDIDSPTIKDHIAYELWRIHDDHPEWSGFKSEEIRAFMNQRTSPPAPNNPDDEGSHNPPNDPPIEGQRWGSNEGSDNPHHDPHDEGAGESLKPGNPETLKKKTLSESAPPPRTTDPDPFDEFWDLVPRKVKKPAARKAFAAAVKRADGGAQAVVDGMRRYADDPNLPDPRGPEASFIMHPATWLRGDCWDDPALPPRGGAGKSARGASERRTAAPGDYLSILRGEDPGPPDDPGTLHAVAEIVPMGQRGIS